jgi:hypothetical protein
MRLLDKVAQSRAPVLIVPAAAAGAPIVATGPADFAREVAACPLRYVLADDLTRAAAELAFSEGDRLAGCLDLLRIPAASLWVEWNDEVHQQVLHESGSTKTRPEGAAGRQVGLLVRALGGGREGVVRTFWSDGAQAGADAITLSPLETHVRLSDATEVDRRADWPSRADLIRVTDAADAGVNALLECTRFRFDASWARYYRTAIASDATRENVVRDSLAAVARDVPLLLAFLLLLNARDATRSAPVDRQGINHKRAAAGKRPLLDHVEIRASLDSVASMADSDGSSGLRRPARIHHVRGHIVRRGLNVFWRSPHVRGRATLGSIRTRTVCLAFNGHGAHA